MNHPGNNTGRLRKTAMLGLLCVILCACGRSHRAPQEPTPERRVERVGEQAGEDALEVLAAPSEIPLGTFEVYDTDDDGQDDRFVYSFSEEEVAEDLFLRRSIEYREADGAYDGRIELRFENRGDEAIDYWHIEEIPKEFAEGVDELEFSAPPDEIIDPDPKVKLRVQLDRQTADLTVETLISIIKRSASTDLEQTAQRLTNTLLVYQMRRLDRLVDRKDRDRRLIELAGQFRRELAPRLPASMRTNPELLAWLCAFATSPAIHQACTAIITDDATSCDRLEEAVDKDLCRALLIDARCARISDPKEREECTFTQAIDLGSSLACLHIAAEDDKNLCLAGVTGQEDYCEKIADAAKRQACLEAVGKKEVVYDTDSWWTTDEKARYEALVSGFDTKECEPVASSLYCDYTTVWRDEKVPDESAEDRAQMKRSVDLEINTWPTDAAARKHWREDRVGFYTEEEIRRRQDELDEAGLGGYIRVESEAILEYEPYVHMVWGQQCSVIHNHSLTFLHGNCIVSLRDTGAPEQALETLNSAVNPVKALIDEKRGAAGQ